jgi:rhombotail lipoprotein
MRRLVALLALVTAFSGCSFDRYVSRRSSLMSYLYPEATEAPPPNTNVQLQLPLRIGIAFVPPDGRSADGGDFRYVFPPATETQLLSIVKKSFTGRDWVSDIVMIPSSYLQPRGGFENLDQVARLMNVDVIALTSLDQMQVSHPRRASFLYISVIGAYVLPLDKNQTRTLIDTAVFHVPSRTFLLRAPGVNSITGSSTAVDIPAKLEERSTKSFKLAMEDLAKNLDAEVGTFKASIASGERKDVDIVTREGRSVRGGGAFGLELWTCHLMHWGWAHALLNAIAAVPPLIVLRRRWREAARFVLIAAPIIAIAVQLGFDGEYRGASGLVMALWVYAGITTGNGLLLVAAGAKLAAEALGLTPAHEGYVTVALAHYAGAVVGLIGGVWSARTPPRERSVQDSPECLPASWSRCCS